MTRLQYVDLHLGVVTRDHHFLVLPRSRRAAPRLSGGSPQARRRWRHRPRQRFEFYKGLGFSPQAGRATWSRDGPGQMRHNPGDWGSFRLMAQDFYPVIARAVAGLDENGAEARRVVYDHARTVLVRQLRKLNTGLSIGLHELEALNEAIRKVELEAARPGDPRNNAMSLSDEK
jgi:hypothetical protein